MNACRDEINQDRELSPVEPHINSSRHSVDKKVPSVNINAQIPPNSNIVLYTQFSCVSMVSNGLKKNRDRSLVSWKRLFKHLKRAASVL